MRSGFLEKAAKAAGENTAAWRNRFGVEPEPRDRARPLFLAGEEGVCSVIAEVKMASPSAGEIMAGSDPLRLPPAYAEAGAGAISVVVEEQYFRGSPELFRKVAEVTDLPLLWKDFVIDPYQVRLAGALGASAVLLIAGMLEDDELKGFLDLSAQVGVKALVEVHDPEELERAVAAGAGVIGVNNRNLVTLQVDLAVSERLSEVFPPGVRKVAESGIRRPEDVARMARAGYDAVLVGQSLVTSEDPGDLLRQMVEAGKNP